MPTTYLSRSSHLEATLWTVGDGNTTTSATSFALNTAYSWTAPGSALNTGKAVATSLIVDATGDNRLTDVWINVLSFSGTWSNTDQNIQISLHIGSALDRIPGALLYTQNIALVAGQVGWYKLTISASPTLTPSTPYYLVVSDSDGGATNFVTLNVAFGVISYGEGASNTTLVGWANNAVGTFVTPPTLIMCKVGGIVYGGIPLTTISTIANDTLPVGITLQFESDMELMGIATNTSTSIWNGATVKLYKASVLPSGTPEATWGSFNSSGLFRIDQKMVPLTPFTMQKNVLYYLILQKGVAAVAPRIFTSNGAIDADLRTLFPLQGKCYAVRKTSAILDTWTEDPTSMYNIAALVRPSAQTSTGFRNISLLLGSNL